MKDCPKCELVNPDAALRCDCGYDFPTGDMKPSYLTVKNKKIAGGAIVALFAVPILIRLTLIGTAGTLDPQMKGVALILLAILIVALLVWRSRSSRLR
jgi:hypothetical protein